MSVMDKIINAMKFNDDPYDDESEGEDDESDKYYSYKGTPFVVQYGEKELKTYYHEFEPYHDRKSFWKVKSHRPYLWGDGDIGNSNRYIGFLGYELSRDGRLRLRKSNISRIAEKFRRQQYALRRYRKNHTTDEFLKRQKEALDKIMDSVDYYKGLDLSMFKLGAQYRYLKQLRKKTMSKLNI